MNTVAETIRAHFKPALLFLEEMADSENVPGGADDGKPSLNFTASDMEHLKEAQRWAQVGVWDAATQELESITPELRDHPHVLKIRFNVYLAAKHMELAVEASDATEPLMRIEQEQPENWVQRERTDEAQEKLRTAADKFPQDWRIQYDLARYACQLGELEDARALLERAIELGDAEKVKLKAIDDPDLSHLFTGSK